MKRMLLTALLIIVAAVLILYIGFEWREVPPGHEEDTVLLVTDDDTGWFFLQLKEGAEAACHEKGAQLRVAVVPAGIECDMNEARRAKGVLLYLSSPQIRKKAEECARDKGIDCRSIYGQGDKGVRMDEKAGGARLAELVPGNHSLSMVYTREDETTRLRIEGAQSVLRGAVPIRLDPASSTPTELFFTRACIAMDEAATIMMAEMKEEGRLPLSMLLFGYDTGNRRVHDLEKGTVYAMVMAEPYALGYAGAQSLLSGGAPRLPVARPVTQSTMFYSENVRLVFPLLQN